MFQNYNEYDHFVKSYDAFCQTNWESKYDSKGFSGDGTGKVLEDNEGNIYVAGYNNRQAILIKYNEAMTEQWKYIVSDSIGYEPYYNFEPSIAADPSGNIYFSTSVKFDSTAYDILISKIDPSGNILFSIRIGAPGNSTAQLRAITTDDFGNLIVSGATDVGFIAKYSPTGNRMWVTNYTEFYYYQKLIAKDDDIYFMGDNTIIKYTKTGDELWSSNFQPNSFVNFFLDFKVDKRNNVIACGSGVLQGSSENYIIVKYDTDGNEMWNKYYNGLRNSYDEANSIAVDSLNNVIVSGRAFESVTSPRASLTMLKLDTAGNEIWKKIISNPSGEIAPGKVSVDKFDDVYISSGGGRNAGCASIDFSYLLVKYRSNGDSLWSTVYNHPEYRNFASDFVITKNNSIVMTGKAYGNNTSYDITTLKYSQTSNIQTNNTELPVKFKLEQNYPNPFNPVTVIRYSIPSDVRGQTSDVKLVVYNNLGKEVLTLVNEKQNAGSYSVDFNGANYPSGVYYYKLEAGSFIEVRKMILLK
ncbi:MAG: T9SS type A sorting domain-containing protein [Ignavibacteria bacterium]|nr:T9SS type A sorting domain-containing protein [Ignavibacteria bacterium]